MKLTKDQKTVLYIGLGIVALLYFAQRNRTAAAALATGSAPSGGMLPQVTVTAPATCAMASCITGG